MDLAALRAAARVTAQRMEARLSAAITAGRDMTADEETANTADEAELAGLNAQITTADAAAAATAGATTASKDNEAAAAIATAVTAERSRVLALADLCGETTMSASLRTAIEGGTEAGAFAIGIATAAKARGATMADLRRGAVGADQLPDRGTTGATGKDPKALTGAARGASIVARAAAFGHSAVAHLVPKG